MACVATSSSGAGDSRRKSPEGKAQREGWRRPSHDENGGLHEGILHQHNHGKTNLPSKKPHERVFLNQRCRSEIIHRIDREEGGARNMGWETAEHHERIAREIKRNLFITSTRQVLPDEGESSNNGGICGLDAACNRLEEAIGRIPK